MTMELERILRTEGTPSGESLVKQLTVHLRSEMYFYPKHLLRVALSTNGSKALHYYLD